MIVPTVPPSSRIFPARKMIARIMPTHCPPTMIRSYRRPCRGIIDCPARFEKNRSGQSRARLDDFIEAADIRNRTG